MNNCERETENKNEIQENWALWNPTEMQHKDNASTYFKIVIYRFRQGWTFLLVITQNISMTFLATKHNIRPRDNF